MKIINMTKNTMVASRAKTARNYFERFRGLIGTKPLEFGEGLLIPRCQGIHMFGMGYAIDAVHLDKDRKVLRIEERLRPNTVGAVDFRSDSVLELPAGMAQDTKTTIGDRLMLDEDRDGIPSIPDDRRPLFSLPCFLPVFI